jgi:tyrosine phenol-lyase
MPEIIEPFRIKVVEPIRRTTPEQRKKILTESHFNTFLIDADHVLIDLLTDSGTSAMSAAQWGGMMIGDESYAGSRSFLHFQQVVREITGFKHIIPTHQGRAAEKILMSIVGGTDRIIPNNNHFDTTRANVEFTGAIALDLVIPEGNDPDSLHPFKGNINLEKLEETLAQSSNHVPLGMVTVTNNTGGGQPVSMENIREVSRLYRKYGVPFFIDACRFAENAYFIKLREPGYEDKTAKEIAQEMFSYADGATMSLKKDGFGNIGGFLALNDDVMADHARNLLILTEGFPTYGGLAGRDLEALAIGLNEVLDEAYLEYRLATVRYLGERITDSGASIVQPPGGHAVYVDARRFYDHLPASAFPAQTLVCELYAEGGMFGRCLDGVEIPADRELVRLAMPRRVYTQAHVNYVGEVFARLWENRHQVRGLKIVRQAPILRHFTAWFEPL